MLITKIVLYLKFIDRLSEISDIELLLDDVRIHGESINSENDIYKYKINVLWKRYNNILLTIKYKFNNEFFGERMLIIMGNIYTHKITKEQTIDHRDKYFLN